ncbi:MAG: type II toxin-antitoxin system death-on-curing family toxin [Alphaproteobacteria bacterium]|nr:MAG: type II toxin-antitoxin system death-on-curing family toxin [Alphaproteobacteria bacterium]
MNEPVWLLLEAILAAHDAQLAEHCGGAGVRDQGLLDSALACPLNLFAYGEPSLPRLAASYAFGIARTHPFVDGNKRTAVVAAELFVGLNGFDLTADDVELVQTFLALAAGELTEEELAAWIDRNTHVRSA